MAENLDSSTVALLHSAILQTGADVREVGHKIDTFISTQGIVNTHQAVEMVRLKTVDEVQQQEIDTLKQAPDKLRYNKVAILGVVMGALGCLGSIAQALIIAFHK